MKSLLLVLVRALFPARGRHRASTARLPLPVQPLPRYRHNPCPVEYDTPLVRPYLLTPAERHERRRQRQRRRALWLAAYGIDVGPRRIHGVEVSP
ncbi:hypothetical protein [Streptomyces cupreus]|uniref:Uncharacterized protein n=1 Tax=Streptomyces cupreus TaxID=2759956 RepID=A0A7X1J4P2_9ACTN|nr:hypothetical protein [Streptomyces cupreus]MBC2904051.1 hypothetical protein [Streptomyces cupreus]